MQKKRGKKDGGHQKMSSWEEQCTTTGWGGWEEGPVLGKQDMEA